MDVQQVLLLLLCDLQIFYELFNSPDAGQNHILAPEWVLPVEDLERCLLLVLAAEEVRVGARELIQIGGEYRGSVQLFALLHILN